MKQALILLVFLGLAARAETQSISIKNERPEITGARAPLGVRVALLVPLLTQYGDVRGTEATTMSNLDGIMGVSVGYARLPCRKLGFLGGVSFMEVRSEGAGAGLARIDANAAFAIDERLYVKGGANFSQWMRGELSSLGGQIGFQGGIGYRFTSRYGLEAGYTQMRQQSGEDSQISEEGAEIGLHGTF